MRMIKYRIYWIILLLLFIYNDKRYDIDDYYQMRYNGQITIDGMI
jgi:hypothetical protein